MSDGIVTGFLAIAGDRRQDQLFSLLVVLAAFLAYISSFGNGFAWDDTNVIITNPVLGGSPLALFNTIDVGRDYELLPYYRPLAQLTFLIEGRLHGFNPKYMHVVNVLLHVVNSFLVYRLARIFSGKNTAFLAGLLFAVHPINTETVNFLSGGRNTMLASLFALLAFLVYRRAVLQDSFAAATMSSLFFLAGLFSKESAFMAVAFMVGLEFAQQPKNTQQWRHSLIRLLPCAAASSMYLVMRWITLSPLGIQASIIPGFGADKLMAMYNMPDLWERVFDNIYIIPRYFLTLILPLKITLRYEVPQNLAGHALLLVIAWSFIIMTLIWLLGKGLGRMTLFGLVWFVVWYLPVSGIAMFPSTPMADRYLYLPAIGLWLVAADQTSRLSSFRQGGGRRFGAVVAAIVIVALGGRTAMRNFDWRDDITLFGKFAEQYPDNAYSHAGLGNAYYAMRERNSQYLDLAEEELLKTLEMQPLIQGVHLTLGNIRLTKGDNEGALHYYTIALGIYPLEKEALLNRAITLENLGRGSEALDDFKRFLAIPGYELSDARPYAEARIAALSK